MSSDRLKIAKSIRNVDNYSKNPIIDSLIKQKLQSEMKIVKENFSGMIRKEEAKREVSKSGVRSIRKRTMSVQDLVGLSPERIRASLGYNPTVAQETLNFLTQRQHSSPFY
jgi:hypothetical protein